MERQRRMHAQGQATPGCWQGKMNTVFDLSHTCFADATRHSRYCILYYMSACSCERVSCALSSSCLHRWMPSPPHPVRESGEVCQLCTFRRCDTCVLESFWQCSSIRGGRWCCKNLECNRNGPSDNST